MATLGEILRWCVITISNYYGRVAARLLRRDRLVIASESKFRALLEYAPDATVIVNWHGHVELVNAQAEKLFGWPRAEIVGQNITDLVPVRYRAAHRNHMKRFMARPEARSMGEGLELHALRRDGTEFPCEISLGPLETDQGLLVSCVIRDVTGRREIEAELRARAEALERSNDELERFASVASHDLSTPLRSVEGFTALLQKRYEGRLGPDADEFIGHTRAAVERMRALIDDLLEYSRVSAQEEPLGVTNLGAAVRAALELIQAQIDETGARITLGELPTLKGDQARMTQLFQNLISNGIKFSRADPPEVAVSAERAGEGLWRITVRDNGIGIDPAIADRIFEMFQRAHGTDQFEGTGIGLAICKRIVEQHGGSISAQPAPDGGTIVSFTIPASEERAGDGGRTRSFSLEG